MKIKEILEDIDTIEKPSVANKTSTQEIPLNKPGGFNVVLLNDNVTPFEVVVEALQAVLGLPASVATKRMMQAHHGGWIVVATFASADVAETKANRLTQHCQNNKNYDHYRTMPGIPKYPRGPGQYQGPWPTTFDVMEAG